MHWARHIGQKSVCRAGAGGRCWRRESGRLNGAWGRLRAPRSLPAQTGLVRRGRWRVWGGGIAGIVAGDIAGIVADFLPRARGMWRDTVAGPGCAWISRESIARVMVAVLPEILPELLPESCRNCCRFAGDIAGVVDASGGRHSGAIPFW